MRSMFRAIPFAQETQLTQGVNTVETRFFVNDPSVFGSVPGVLSLWEGTSVGETVIMISKGSNFIDVQRGTPDTLGIVQPWVSGTKIAALIDAGQINSLQDNVTELDTTKQPAGNYIVEGDPRLTDARPANNVPSWAMQPAKPTYTASDVGAAPATHASQHASGGTDAITPTAIGAETAGTAASQVSTHNTNASAHSTQFAAKADLVHASRHATGQADAITPAAIGAMPALVPITNIAASAMLTLTHAGNLLTCGSASAITITIPADATANFPIGSQITVTQTNVGAVTVSPASGVTLNSKDTKRGIDGQYAAATLVKTAANTWYLWGALV